MPKIYPGSEQQEKQDRESKTRKTVDVYDKPERSALSKEIIVAVGLIVVIALLFMLYRLVWGGSLLIR